MDADLRSAIAHDELLRDRRRLSTGLIALAVALFVAAWFTVPGGVLLVLVTSNPTGALLIGVGVLAAAGGAIALIVGLRMRRAVARDIHSPESAPGKPNARFQEDPAFLASHNAPYNWTGLGPGGN